MSTIAAAANSGLNLNMSAAQLRARLAAQKKYDPKREAMDLRRKHEIIQTMWIINPHTQQSTRKVEECNRLRVKGEEKKFLFELFDCCYRVLTIGNNLTLIIFHLFCLVSFLFFSVFVFSYFIIFKNDDWACEWLWWSCHFYSHLRIVLAYVTSKEIIPNFWF